MRAILTGIARQISLNLLINTELIFGILLTSPDTSIGGEEPDIEIDTIIASLVVTLLM